jgi:hypothetical protein
MGAGIAHSEKRLVTGWTTEGSEFESRQGQEFSLLHVVQTGFGAHPGSYPKLLYQRRKADHPPTSSAEVRKSCIYTSTPPYAFMA